MHSFYKLKIDISINIVVRMAMLQTYHVSNGFNCISKCTILQCFHPIHWFPFLFFSFFTIQLTKLQVILSFEEEFASIICSTINKHDTPRNTLLSRNRKNEKKSQYDSYPPHPNNCHLLSATGKTKTIRKYIQSCLCHLSKIFRFFFHPPDLHFIIKKHIILLLRNSMIFFILFSSYAGFY